MVNAYEEDYFLNTVSTYVRGITWPTSNKVL